MAKQVERVSKPELEQRIKSEHQSLLNTLDQLDSEQMIQAGAVGSWSVKDVLSNITFWEQRLVCWLEEESSGKTPQVPAPGMTWRDLQRLNEQTYLECQDKSLDAVLASFHSSFEQVLRLIESLSEDELIDPHRFVWRRNKPLWTLVADCTCRHYEHHNADIRKWISKMHLR